MNCRKFVVIAGVLVLAGCTTPRVEQLQADAVGLYAARSVVSGQPQDRAVADGDKAAELLARPIDSDTAVQIALLHNPRVAAIYARLGFARADLYDAVRLSNPTLGYVRLSGADAARKVDWSLSQNFTELLFMRWRAAGAQSRVVLAEQQVAHDLLELEADVRAAHVRQVGSKMVTVMRQRVARSTEVSAGYAQQLFAAGNISKLQLARLQEAADLAKTETLRAQASETADRNALLTLLGLRSDAAVHLVGDYALPLAELPVAADLRAWALDNRLDLLSVREALRFATRASTHARRWRWLGESTVGVVREQDGSRGSASGETLVGPSLSLALPIFNQGAGSVDRARAEIDSLAAEVLALELSIGNETATRLAALAAAHKAVTLYREQLVPVQRVIVEESQKQQNYMLIGAFELLSAKQHQYEGYEAYIGALRDYWLAYVELLRATGGRFPGAPALTPEPSIGELP